MEFSETPIGARTSMGTKYPNKSCRKWVFFKGRGWSGRRSKHYDQLYRKMKRFGKATITLLYNAQTISTRQAWCKPEVQWQIEEVLHQLLKDLHPNRACRRLLAEEDMYLLKHITYQTVREFRIESKEHVGLGKCKDQEWIPEEYKDALEGEIRPMYLADEHADETGYADGDGVDDRFDFNAFSPNTSSPNTSSPLSNSGSPIEADDAMGDLDPIPSYYTSQDAYSLSPPPNAATIEPNPNMTVNLHDTEFSMGPPTGHTAPLTNNSGTVDDNDVNTMDNFISPSFSWNDTHWDAFVDIEISTPTDDIDMILRNATSVNAQHAVQAPDTLQLNHALVNEKPEWNNFLNTTPNETTNASAPSQHPISVPNTTHLPNTSPNWDPEYGIVDINALTRSYTTPKECANVSAVAIQYNLPSSNADASYHSMAQDLSTLPNEYGNPADYAHAGSSFDREGNAACDPNDWTTDCTPTNWTTTDRTTTDLYPPDFHTPHATYPSYNVEYTSP